MEHLFNSHFHGYVIMWLVLFGRAVSFESLILLISKTPLCLHSPTGIVPADLDFATPATPDQMKALFAAEQVLCLEI